MLTTKDLQSLDKRLEAMEQKWREWSPLYAGDILTDEDLVKLLKVSKRTLSTYRKNGILTYSQVGKMIWYSKADIMNFLNKNKAN